MKVCQYIPHGSIPDVRGFAPAVLAQEFYKNFSDDIEHYFVSNQENYQEKYSEDKVFGKIFRIKEGKLYKRFFQKITKLDPCPLHKRLAKIINKHPVDILHVHQLEFPVNQFKKLLKSKNKNIKIIVHAHVYRSYNNEWGEADKYLAVSNSVKEYMAQNGFNIDKLVRLSNGVNVDVFKPVSSRDKQELRQNFNLPQEKMILTFVGRKQEVKGFEQFLKIADHFINKRDDLFFLAVGPEPKGSQKEKTFKEREVLRKILQKNSNYLELQALKHFELAKIYQLSDLAILLSKDEPQGMVMIEFLSSGCLVLSSAIGGIMESIEDKYNGFLVQDPSNFKAILSKVEYILDNFSHFSHMKENARESILQRYDMKKIVSQLENIYKN